MERSGWARWTSCCAVRCGDEGVGLPVQRPEKGVPASRRSSAVALASLVSEMIWSREAGPR